MGMSTTPPVFPQVNKVLASLQNEVENFILRMAAEFPLRKEQLIFLINNYDMMLSVLMVSPFYITPFRFLPRCAVVSRPSARSAGT